jgi:uncharacterized protein
VTRPAATAPTVIVIAKEPRPGAVKTRLCPPCTPAEAARLAVAALADTLEAVATVPGVERVLALEGAAGRWVPPGFRVVAQRGRGLDERIAAAFADGAGDRPALLIGMDTPQVDRELLAGALGALQRPGVDAVLGPALDGGWWCIGLRRADDRVFRGVEMSTARTGSDQRARLVELEFATVELPALRDVDTIVDAIEVAATIPASRFARTLEATGVLERASGPAPGA